MADSRLYAQFAHDLADESGVCEEQHERAVDVGGDESGPTITWDAPVPQVCPHCGKKLTKDEFSALSAEWEKVREAELELMAAPPSAGLMKYLDRL